MLLTGASHLFRVALARYKKNSIDIHLQASLHERSLLIQAMPLIGTSCLFRVALARYTIIGTTILLQVNLHEWSLR